MAQLLKYTEWENCGLWFCNDLSSLSSIRAKWWAPARMLNMTPAAYAEMIYTKYKPDFFRYSVEHDVLIYGWKSQAKMRVYKNWLNKQARERKFII